MCSKFIPYRPNTIVGTAVIATQLEILRRSWLSRTVDLREVGLQYPGQQLVEGADALGVARQVIVDVAEVVGGPRVQWEPGLIAGQRCIGSTSGATARLNSSTSRLSL